MIVKLVNYRRFCVLHTRASWIIFISLHSRHFSPTIRQTNHQRFFVLSFP